MAEECLIATGYTPSPKLVTKKNWEISFLRHYAHGVELSITIAILLFGIGVSVGMNAGMRF
jgi:hypothetical protein